MKSFLALIILTTSSMFGAACLSADDVAFDLGTDAGPVMDGSALDASGGDAAPADSSTGDAELSDLSSPDLAPPDAGPTDAASIMVNVLNAADEPFAGGTGAIATFGSARFVASTATAVVVYGLGDGHADSAYLPMVLTSTQFGGNAAGAIALHASSSDTFAFFLPTGSPQVGLLDLAPPGAVVTEAVLASGLGGGFSADLEVDGAYLYVADAPFGSDSVVRRYDLDGFTRLGNLAEDVPARFVLPTEDLDGDQVDEVLVAGRLAFSSDGSTGFVAFTVLGNSAPALAGGVLAFDPETGLERGRVLVPTAGSSTIAQGFVSGFVLTDTQLLVVTAEKQFVPTFAELGGHLSIYDIVGANPFAVADTDSNALYDQPSHQVATSDDNPVGLAVFDDVVLVVNAPFFLDGTLDVFELGTSPRLRGSLPLGPLYQTGYWVPTDPVPIPSTRNFLLATEAGTLRFEVEPR